MHSYGTVSALNDVSLEARRGDFVALLGESGSGKTMLLRVISGLEKPRSVDQLVIGGVDVRDTPASRCHTTDVFQRYALFPHLSVRQNVEYGLRVRGVPPEERWNSAREAFGLVRLPDKVDRHKMRTRPTDRPCLCEVAAEASQTTKRLAMHGRQRALLNRSERRRISASLLDRRGVELDRVSGELNRRDSPGLRNG